MNMCVDKAVDTFINFKYKGDSYYKAVNDAIFQHGDNLIWTYHGNNIAKANTATRNLMVTLAGWPTKSTMERLNTLLQKLGVKGCPFRGHGNRRFLSHPTFCGNPIKDTEEINIALDDIPNGVYDVSD